MVTIQVKLMKLLEFMENDHQLVGCFCYLYWLRSTLEIICVFCVLSDVHVTCHHAGSKYEVLMTLLQNDSNILFVGVEYIAVITLVSRVASSLHVSLGSPCLGVVCACVRVCNQWQWAFARASLLLIISLCCGMYAP